jgi:hypothetical protein
MRLGAGFGSPPFALENDMTEEVKKRGRPAKVSIEKPEAGAEGALKVIECDVIHDGEGGFMMPGTWFVPVDEYAAAHYKKQRYAE